MDSFEEFLDVTGDDARLVHCGEEDLAEYERIATEHSLIPHRNLAEPAALRKMAANECYFVTEKRLMRGFDYRGADQAASTTMAGSCGSSAARTKLSLLLTCPADTGRDYL